MTALYLHEDAKELLAGKTLVVIGDSVERSVYKDLVCLLQENRYLSDQELRKKGEESFMGDELVEGGVKGEMKNSIDYRECRYFKADNEACCRYYFVTICYGDYVEKVLQELSLVPTDIIVMNSCLWDVHRHGKKGIEKYEENLEKLVTSLRRLLPDCLFLWLTTPPVNIRSKGGFLMKPGTDLVKINEVKFCNEIAREVFTGANNIDRRFRIVDLDAVFQYFEHHRASDGVHWNERAHRRMSNMILEQVSKAFNKEVPRKLGGNHNPWDNNMQQQQNSNEFENFHEPQQPLRWDDFDHDGGWGHRPPFPLPGRENWNNERFDEKWGYPNERPPGPPGYMFSPNRPPMPLMPPFGPLPMMPDPRADLCPDLDDLAQARRIVEHEHQQEFRKRKNRDDEVSSPTMPEKKYRFGVTARKQSSNVQNEPSAKVTIVDTGGVMKKLVELNGGVTLHAVLSEKEKNDYQKDLAEKEMKRKEKERLEKQQEEEQAAQAKAAEEKRAQLEKKELEEKEKLSAEMNEALNEVAKLPLVSEIPVEENIKDDPKKENVESKFASKLLSFIKAPVDTVKFVNTDKKSPVCTDATKSTHSTTFLITTTSDSPKLTITLPTLTTKSTVTTTTVSSTVIELPTTTVSITSIEPATTTHACVTTPTCSTSSSTVATPPSLMDTPLFQSTLPTTSVVATKSIAAISKPSFCLSDAINTSRHVVPVYSTQNLAPGLSTKISPIEPSAVVVKPVALVDHMALLSQLGSPFAKQKPKTQVQAKKDHKKLHASDVTKETPMTVDVTKERTMDPLNDSTETDFESSLLDGDQEEVDETLSDVDESILDDSYVPSQSPLPALPTPPLDEKAPINIVPEQKPKAAASTTVTGKVIDMTNKKLPTQKKKITVSGTTNTAVRKPSSQPASSNVKQVKKKKKDKHPNETKEERRLRKQKKKQKKEKLKADKKKTEVSVFPSTNSSWHTPIETTLTANRKRSAPWAPSYYPTYENKREPQPLPQQPPMDQQQFMQSRSNVLQSHQPNQQGMFTNYTNNTLLAQQQQQQQQHHQQQRQQQGSFSQHQIQQPQMLAAVSATASSQQLQQVNAMTSKQPQQIATTYGNQSQLYIDEFGQTYTLEEETYIVGPNGHMQSLNAGTTSAYVQQQQQQQMLQQFSQPSLVYATAAQQAMQQQARYL